MSKPSKGTEQIKSLKQLADWLRAGCESDTSNLKIGPETENIVYYADNYEPVPYEGENGRKGIKDLLEGIRDKYGWTPVVEEGHLIGLERGDANISIEPGGQLELSGAPHSNLHEAAAEIDNFIAEALDIAEGMGMEMIGMGYQPLTPDNELPLMPKSRYEGLRDYIDSRGFTDSFDIMCSACTVQTNFGFKSEEDMKKKLRVGLALQPVAVALLASSPFAGGEDTGYQSYRSHQIHNAIGGRYGFMLPIAFEDDFDFDTYADFALNDMPLLGIYKDEKFLGTGGKSFRDFMEGKLDAVPGEKATMKDWVNHLNTIWPEVRLRQFLEMRGADNNSAEMIKGVQAFWIGLMYDDEALDAAYEMVKDWTEEDREYLRTAAPKDGLQTQFLGTDLQDIAKNVLALSEAGLKRRNIQNEAGQDESVYLAPLKVIADAGKNYAQVMKEKYDGEWGQDMTRLFDEFNHRAQPSIEKLLKRAPVQQPTNDNADATADAETRPASAHKRNTSKNGFNS